MIVFGFIKKKGLIQLFPISLFKKKEHNSLLLLLSKNQNPMPPHSSPTWMDSFKSIQDHKQTHAEHEYIEPGWLQDRYQWMAKRTPTDSVSTSMETEERLKLLLDMNQEDRAIYIHSGIVNTDNFFIKRVMPYIPTDKLYHKIKVYTIDYSDVHVVPYGSWNGQVTSSHREMHFNLLPKSHGITIDGTQLSDMSGEEGLIHVEHLFKQLFLDIHTTDTMAGLTALVECRSIERYYIDCDMNWQVDQEAALKQHRNQWLCFAVRTSGRNDFYAYLSLGKRIIAESNYNADILIMPQGAEELIVKTIHPDASIYNWKWDEMENKMTSVKSEQSMDRLPNSEIEIYSAPKIKLHHYQKNYKEGSFRPQEETTTLSEWYMMHSGSVYDNEEFKTEFCDIEIYSYNDDTWVKVGFLDAIKKCRYFKEDVHGDLEWNPEFLNWIKNGNARNPNGNGNKCLFSSGHDEPVDYIGEIKIGEDCDSITEKSYMRMAKSLAMKLMKINRVDIDSVLGSGISLVRDISQIPYNAAFFDKLITKNKTYASAKAKPAFVTERNKRNNSATDVLEYEQNEYGGLILPNDNSGNDLPALPPGFTSFGCLKTLSRESLNNASHYQDAGKKIKPFVEILESIAINLKTILPHSILNDPDNIPSWIHSKSSANILIRTLLPDQNNCLFMADNSTPKAATTLSLEDQYDSLVNDAKVDAKWNAVFADNTLKKEVLAFISEKQRQTSDFSPYNWLMSVPENEITRLLKTPNQGERKKQLEESYDSFIKLKIIVNRVQKQKAAKITTPERTSGGTAGWYRIPLIATQGLRDSIPGVATPLVLPADPRRNYETFVAKDQIKDISSNLEDLEQRSSRWIGTLEEPVKIAQNRPILSQVASSSASQGKSIGDMFFDFDKEYKKPSSSKGSEYEQGYSRWYNDEMKHNISRAVANFAPLDRLASLALIFSRNVPSTILSLAKNDCELPFGVLLLRPLVTHRTSAPILVATGANGLPGSQPLGGIYKLNGFPIESLDHGMRLRYDVRYHSAAFVKDENRVWVHHDAIPVRIVSGCNANFFKEGLDDMELAGLIETEDHEGTLGSLFSVVVPNHYRPKKDIVHLCTRHTKSTSSLIPCGDYFDNNVGKFSSVKERITDTKFDSNCFGLAERTTCMRFNPRTRQYDMKDVGTSHNSPYYDTGAAAFFKGQKPHVVN